MFCRILCCFVAKSFFYVIYAVLSRNLFCRGLRALTWSKIEPKIVTVQKKGQIWGMHTGKNFVFLLICQFCISIYRAVEPAPTNIWFAAGGGRLTFPHCAFSNGGSRPSLLPSMEMHFWSALWTLCHTSLAQPGCEIQQILPKLVNSLRTC